MVFASDPNSSSSSYAIHSKCRSWTRLSFQKLRGKGEGLVMDNSSPTATYGLPWDYFSSCLWHSQLSELVTPSWLIKVDRGWLTCFIPLVNRVQPMLKRLSPETDKWPTWSGKLRTIYDQSTNGKGLKAHQHLQMRHTTMGMTSFAITHGFRRCIWILVKIITRAFKWLSHKMTLVLIKGPIMINGVHVCVVVEVRDCVSLH